MNKYYSIEEAKSKAQSHEFIIAHEKSISLPGRCFVVGSHIDLIYWYANLQIKSGHEIRIPNKPIKLYFDLEEDVPLLLQGGVRRGVGATNENFNTKVHEIINKVDTLYKSTKPLFLDSSREDKHSLHVVYPQIMFKTLDELSFFINQNFNNISILDTHVYKKGSLRLPYAIGFNKPVPLLPLINKEFDLETFKLGMLHYFEIPLSLYKISHKVKNNNKRVFSSTTTMPLRDLIEELWAQPNNYKIESFKEINNEIKMIIKYIKCPLKNNVHKSNNTFVTINLNELNYPSTFTCLDTIECKGVSWKGINFSTLLKKDEMVNSLKEQYLLSL
jgi:hypothetical protein